MINVVLDRYLYLILLSLSTQRDVPYQNYITFKTSYSCEDTFVGEVHRLIVTFSHYWPACPSFVLILNVLR
jgi:hypothetical protein